MGRKRVGLAALVVLLCLTGCVVHNGQPTAPPHEGVWYFAKNAVECQIGQGKIYEDDLHAKEGQSLRGVYSETDGHIEAHLAGVGGVQASHTLYVVQTDQGEVLCDSPSGDGTVYFYRDALAALEALEATQTSPSPAPSTVPSNTPAPSLVETLPPLEPAASPAEPSSRSLPNLGEIPSSPEPLPSLAVKGSGDMVWVPQSGSKYHSTSSCSGMKNPSQVTKAEAERQGYTPCKRCY